VKLGQFTVAAHEPRRAGWKLARRRELGPAAKRGAGLPPCHATAATGAPTWMLAGHRLRLVDSLPGGNLQDMYPRRRSCLLHHGMHLPVTPRFGCRLVPHNLVVKPVRYDQRQHPRRVIQGRLQRRSLDQPECPGDRAAGNTVRVRMNLSGMQRHPQPDPRVRRAGYVVIAQCRRQLDRQPGHQPALGHLRGDQDQRTVPAVLDTATRPADPGAREGTCQRLVHAVPDRDLICVSPSRVTELLHVNDQDRPVHSRLMSSQSSHPSNDPAIVVSQCCTLRPAKLSEAQGNDPSNELGMYPITARPARPRDWPAGPAREHPAICTKDKRQVDAHPCSSAEMSTSSMRVSIDQLEHSITLAKPCHDHRAAFSIVR